MKNIYVSVSGRTRSDQMFTVYELVDYNSENIKISWRFNVKPNAFELKGTKLNK